MTYDTLMKDFIEGFPELESESQREFEIWRDEDPPEPPAHVFFGNVLNPYLVQVALVTKENPEFLKRIFEFLERMATSNDEDVRGVLTATILLRIGDDKTILNCARSFMGKETLKLSHQVERSWGRE